MAKPLLFRILAGVPGLLFLVQGFGWLLDPESAAKGLGMPLLDGVARSTQIGDIGSFFFAIAALALLGVITVRATWLYAAAMLLGGAAVMRTAAWALHDAPFTLEFIVVESVLAALLVFVGTRFDAEPA